VLVVDDNVDAARSLSVLLRRAGHETQAAHDGQAAMEAVEAFRPDVILLDIGLPGMNGYDVAHSLKKRTSAFLAAVSGYAPKEDGREAVFDRYLVKPVNPDAILGLLAESGDDAPR
jgi:two-component system CheB/CheR fusion protein